VTKAFRTILIAVFSLALATPVIAQQSDDVHASGSNLLRVGSGSTEDVQNALYPKRYFEEIANARLFYQYFSIGLRYEMDDPSEVGRSYQDRNFRKRWISYRKDDLDLQAGDVSALFGRGLALNLFESRPLNYDSWLDGAYGKTELKIPKSLVDANMAVTLKGIGGQEDFYPVPTSTGADTLPSHISARAIDAEFSLYRHKLILGAAFLQAFTQGDLGAAGNTSTREVNQPDFYADMNVGEFQGFFEWTQNRSNVNELLPYTAIDSADYHNLYHKGNSYYGAISYANSDFGLNFEYKNYGYYIHNRISSSPDAVFEGAFSKLPISSPPEVYKDFVFGSIVRSNHPVFFDDELGAQLEATITAIPHYTIDLYGAASSSHNKYNVAGVAVDSVSLIPKVNDWGYYPFWEAYGEVEWNFTPDNDLNYLRFAVHRRSDVIAYVPVDSSAEIKMSTTVAAKLQYETTPNQSVLAIVEHQWMFDGSRPADHRTLNDMITLQYSYNPYITFGGILDMSIQYELGPYHIENTWPQGFVSTRLGTSHTLLVSYGAERAGINCTGGICRYVPAFKGLRLTLTSQF
jgi:hypothetical protein